MALLKQPSCSKKANFPIASLSDMAVHFNLRSYWGSHPLVVVVTNLIQRNFSWYGSNDLKA